MSNVTVQEALKAAIEALDGLATGKGLINPIEYTIEQCKAALAEIEKCEPVYQAREIGETDWENCTKEHYDYCKTIAHLDTRILDTSPQPRDWVGLSDIDKAECASHTSKLGILGAVNATEAKCKQLNTKG